jgi:hypothetical protein
VLLEEVVFLHVGLHLWQEITDNDLEYCTKVLELFNIIGRILQLNIALRCSGHSECHSNWWLSWLG